MLVAVPFSCEHISLQTLSLASQNRFSTQSSWIRHSGLTKREFTFFFKKSNKWLAFSWPLPSGNRSSSSCSLPGLDKVRDLSVMIFQFPSGKNLPGRALEGVPCELGPEDRAVVGAADEKQIRKKIPFLSLIVGKQTCLKLSLGSSGSSRSCSPLPPPPPPCC